MLMSGFPLFDFVLKQCTIKYTCEFTCDFASSVRVWLDYSKDCLHPLPFPHLFVQYNSGQ